MAAKIRLEIEGTSEEILEAFKQFVGEPVEYKLVGAPRIPEDEILKFDQKPAYCEYCTKVLTVKQINQGNRFCSRRCSTLGTVKKRNATRKTNKLTASLNQSFCKECLRPLTKDQKQFCSRKCSNRFHNKARHGVKVSKWQPSVSVVAGQGVTKGSALPA